MAVVVYKTESVVACLGRGCSSWAVWWSEAAGCWCSEAGMSLGIERAALRSLDSDEEWQCATAFVVAIAAVEVVEHVAAVVVVVVVAKSVGLEFDAAAVTAAER